MKLLYKNSILGKSIQVVILKITTLLLLNATLSLAKLLIMECILLQGILLHLKRIILLIVCSK